MTQPPPKPQPATLDDVRPKLSGAQWSMRFALVVAALVTLAWAWQDSGMGDSGKLWSNRERAINYIFGEPVDESTLQRRRDEARREIRTEYQVGARADIEQKYDERGEPRPSLMALMRESEALANQRLDQIPPAQLEALINQRLDDAGTGRQGGYFPPETDAQKIFGDPDELNNLHPIGRSVINAAGTLGDKPQYATKWTFNAITGRGYTGKLFETIAIAVWGTLIAVLLAVPASVFGSARGLEVLAPGQSVLHRAMRWAGKFIVRRSFDVSRGFNEIILAMIFVAVLGLGPLPGVLALLIHTYGVLGKVFAEALDTIDKKPVEGVTSTGAGPTQIISFAMLPQVMPYIISQSLLRFESNVRGATILGVVGAGGIGQLLMDKFGAYAFQEVATIMIIIIVVVTLIDAACGKVMRGFV